MTIVFSERDFPRAIGSRTGIPQGNAKLSFAVPVTLHEGGVARVDNRRWRHSPDTGARLRTQFLISSFVKNFNQEHLDTFMVVCPDREHSELTSLVRSITQDCRYRVLPECEICTDVGRVIEPSTGQRDGWRAQQILKLALAAKGSSEYYVTLDSDILCIKPFSCDSLLRERAAVTNGECQSDYQRLYTKQFADIETRTKMMRYTRCAEILGCGPRAVPNVFYGETPVVLHRESVLDLLEFLGKRHRRPWSRVLAETSGWTEYSLYYLFLESAGKVNQICSTSSGRCFFISWCANVIYLVHDFRNSGICALSARCAVSFFAHAIALRRDRAKHASKRPTSNCRLERREHRRRALRC
jgi:hypothetical protein